MTTIINQRVILNAGLEVSSLKSNKLPKNGNLLLYVDGNGSLGVKNSADDVYVLSTQEGLSIKNINNDYIILETDNILLIECYLNPILLTLPDINNVSYGKTYKIVDSLNNCKAYPITIQTHNLQKILGDTQQLP